jgi:Protein phosphatase 2C
MPEEAGPHWPDWRVVCTSVIGRGHLEIYRECQDAFRCNYATLVDPRTQSNGRPPGPLITAISDGLGSAPNSAIGANLAAGIAQAVTRDAFSGIDWQTAHPSDLAHTVHTALEVALAELSAAVAAIRACTRQEWQNSSFNATLLIVVFRPPWLLTANVGDGFVIAQREGGQLLLVERPYVSASDASAVVTALQATALERAQVSCLYDPFLTGFAASTDGLKEISLDWQRTLPEAPHEEFFAPLLAGIADGTLTSTSITRFLHQDRIGAHAADDLTLVAAARAAKADRG